MSRHLHLFEDGGATASAFVATDELPDASLIRLWASRSDLLCGSGGAHFDTWFRALSRGCPPQHAVVLHGWSTSDPSDFFTRIYAPVSGTEKPKHTS